MRKQLLYSFLVLLLGTGSLRGQFLGGQLKAKASPFPPDHVHCNPQNTTAVVEVTNPTTGKTWMDRNLGAEQVATSSTDALSFGDLYQWGRRADGHQCRFSGTVPGPTSLNQPPNDDFIVIPTSNATDDWRNPQNNLLWQGVGGVNNPCPTGFRVPTEAEFRQERLTWSSNSSGGAFNSVLKLPLAGFREQTGAVLLVTEGSAYGFIWTSTVSGGTSSNDAEAFAYYPSRAYENPYARARGYSVRCIKQ